MECVNAGGDDGAAGVWLVLSGKKVDGRQALVRLPYRVLWLGCLAGYNLLRALL